MSAEIGKQILDAVKAFVAAQVGPLRTSVDEVHGKLHDLTRALAAHPWPQKGEPGEPGAKGEPGPKGDAPSEDELRAIIAPLIPAPEKGEPGAKGEPGEKGEPGKDAQPPDADELRAIIAPLIPAPVKGEPGAKGDPGHEGKPGRDAAPPTEEQLRAIITPLIPQPLKGEPGVKGERGEPGKDAPAPSADELRAIITPLIPAPAQGDPGPRGERGEQGASPSADELRALILPLIPAPVCGEKGEPGKDGKDGEDGEPGRDALALEILPAIDKARSYPRGTYARHEGGLWRSFETTHGVRGWECLVEGISHETETLCDDGRTLVRTTVYSSGREFTREFRFSTVLDRGVYKSEHTYAPGDAVTWAGSVWIAQKLESNGTIAPTYGKPGTAGSGWRLAVKAGRDART